MTYGSVAYVPQLKWKAGERAAIANLNPSLRERVMPLFRLCPPGGYESDLGFQLDEGQFLKRFGQHLSDVCGRSPVLLDGEMLDSLSLREDYQHPFHQLLTRARLEGASPVPVFRPSSSDAYKQAIHKHLTWTGASCSCVRVGLFELESIKERSNLLALADEVGSCATDSVLLIDGGPLAITDEEMIAQLIGYHFSRLIREGDWSLVIFSSTTFPEKLGLKAWQSGSFRRADWSLYRQIQRMRDEFPVMPIFSDYGLEYPGNYKPVPVRPSAHLRYSTENRYFVFKGASVGEEDKYANIFRVAEALTSSGIFKGPDFSSGDAYISQLSEKSGRTGHASKWRWCSTDHHLTMVMRQLNSLLGLGVEDPVRHVEPDQLKLILP